MTNGWAVPCIPKPLKAGAHRSSSLRCLLAGCSVIVSPPRRSYAVRVDRAPQPSSMSEPAAGRTASIRHSEQHRPRREESLAGKAGAASTYLDVLSNLSLTHRLPDPPAACLSIQVLDAKLPAGRNGSHQLRGVRRYHSSENAPSRRPSWRRWGARPRRRELEHLDGRSTIFVGLSMASSQRGDGGTDHSWTTVGPQSGPHRTTHAHF